MLKVFEASGDLARRDELGLLRLWDAVNCLDLRVAGALERRAWPRRDELGLLRSLGAVNRLDLRVAGALERRSWP